MPGSAKARLPGDKKAAVKPKTRGFAIPLELRAALAEQDLPEQFTLKIEGIPEGGSLTEGKNYGNRTWSIKDEQIDTVALIPPNDPDPEYTLNVRVLIEDEGFDFGTTVALFTITLNMIFQYPFQALSL